MRDARRGFAETEAGRGRRAAAFAILALALVVPGRAAAWSWPTSGEVLRPFSFGTNPYAAGEHRGIDIGGAQGEKVHAAAGGRITFVGIVPSSGLVVSLLTPDGYAVTLTHLGSASVSKGTTVEDGDVVGAVGPSGDPEVPQPYVHLGVRIAADEQGYVDPLGLLPPRGAPMRDSTPTPAPQPTPTPAPAPASTPASTPAPAK